MKKKEKTESVSVSNSVTTTANFQLGTPCVACEGKGKQLSMLDGLQHVCPSCYGSGMYCAPQQWPILTPIWISPQPVWSEPKIGWQPYSPVITCQSNTAGGIGKVSQ